MNAPLEIKKRSAPGLTANARKRPLSRKEEEDDDDEDVVDEKRLRSIREQQQARHRKKGVSAEALAKSTKPVSTKASGGVTTMETMLSSQFSVTVDNGLATTIPHEKIMQQYIDEKLGLTQTAKNSKESKDPDEIYIMPDELKVQTTAAKADEEVVTTWSTGIAEVALPIGFKLKNMAATEQAARKRLDLYTTSHASASGAERSGDNPGQHRFHIADHSAAADREGGGPPRHVHNPSLRPESASDLKALLDFKKRQMNFRR